ncbi:D-alanyl-D-alanine carboxypeptidase family protein [Kangiella geojedonensis]|uniref:serine-type D-Ala-D-Ala carboxypeptidase n=1 Tax=Kangiella geojedonensis TaxID=914150 RepID=A0A0F6RDI6_9GAMM|nr:D-alanyl-D-alanine carboxypeptidase [Kangiella geojedonensis]
MKRNYVNIVVLGLVLWACSGVAAAIQPAKPSVDASSWLLMDFETGQIIIEENADQQLPPASLTKMMTSYIIADQLHKGNISEQDKVLISENAWAQNPKLKGSSLMFVEVNKYVTVEDLHRGIVIQSGNDASIAMAEHIAGSEEAFADLMNQYAKRLGMNSTHFMNSTGLPHEQHNTTARDLAKLARALIIDFPEDYSLYAEREFKYNGITQQNRNELLGDTTLGVDGIKTGHTEAAGYCLVSSAEKQGMRLISVVMGTDSMGSRASESRKLLNYGFRFYTNVKAFTAGKSLKQAEVWKGEEELVGVGLAQDAVLTVLKSEKDQLKANYKLNGKLMAPIQKGQVVGEVYFQMGDKVVKRMPMVALDKVEEAGFFGRMWDSMALWFED